MNMMHNQLPDRICIIDDDADFLDFMSQYLLNKGLRVSSFGSAEAFLASADAAACDFLIVDLGLPGLDGVDLITMVSSGPQTGILVISGRSGPDAFNCALAAGADMMLHKPIRFDQVYQAILTISRRLAATAPAPSKQQSWEVSSDYSNLVSPDGVRIPLTRLEQRLLARLIAAQGKVVSRGELSDAAGITGEIDRRNLDAAVFRLRQKIEQTANRPAPLRTLRGSGYQLSEPLHEMVQ
jgi:DNA-binding response OmpR family regulator